MQNTKTILAFIAGASIGAIAAILLAPDSGASTRQKIADQSGKLKNALNDSIIAWIDKLQKGVDEEVRQADDNPAPTMTSGAL